MSNNLKSRELAKRFIARAEALSWKGKKRDNAAVEYFVGATHGADLAGDTALAGHLRTLAVLVVAVGFQGVEAMAVGE